MVWLHEVWLAIGGVIECNDEESSYLADPAPLLISPMQTWWNVETDKRKKRKKLYRPDAECCKVTEVEMDDRYFDGDVMDG